MTPVRRFAGLALACGVLARDARAVVDSPWEEAVHRDTTRLLSVTSLFGAFWAVGERGAIMSSADGKLWARRKPFGERTLYGVAFPDASNGCIVGESGLVAITDNGGEAWQIMKPPVNDDLRAVAFGNRNVGVAAGLRGALLVTYDGGRSWFRKDVGYGESLFAVAMPSPSEAWVAGERGLILHSTDAGRTWSAERHPSQKWIYALHFAGDTGWAAGRDGLLLRRLMGVWEPTPVAGMADAFYALGGGAGQPVTVVGAGGRAWSTSDAGVTWVARATGTRDDLRAYAQSGGVGWAAGPENGMFSTIDAGGTWATYPLENPPSYTAVSFADPANGWATGRGGLLWGTRDGGRNWGQQDAGMRRDLTSVWAVSRNLCFASGESSVVKTDNGGLSWRRVWAEPPTSAAELEKPKHLRKPPITLQDVYFFDARRGWAAGTDGTLLYSSNEGEHWQVLQTGIDKGLNAVWFTSPNRGYLGGDDGRLYVTDNGGRRWSAAPTGGGGEPLRSIFFLDPDRGWIVGDGGTILRTADGGATWRELRLGGTLSLRDVWFTDRLHGWIAGERGTLLRTWDGGEIWTSDHPPVYTDYAGVMFTGPGAGFAVGDRGVILRYRGGGGGA